MTFITFLSKSGMLYIPVKARKVLGMEVPGRYELEIIDCERRIVRIKRLIGSEHPPKK